MKILKKTLLWAILTGVFALLLVVVIVGTAVTSYFAPYINSVLGAATSTIIRGDNTENVDTEYFKSDYTYDRTGEEKLIADAQEVYRNSVEEGSVLLKNEANALPLTDSDVNVTVFGGAANQYITGFKDELESAGFTVNEDVWDYYAGKNGTARLNTGIPMWDSSAAIENAQGDVAIVTLARRAGEGTDAAHPGKGAINTATDPTGFQTEGDYLSLSGGEVDMLENVKRLKDAGRFDKIVVIISTSNMIRGDFITDDAYGIDACIWTGQASATYGTEGLVNILEGEVNPSGRLVDSIYVDNLLNPVMANFGSLDGDLTAVTAGLVDEVKTQNYEFNNNPQGNDWDKSVVYQEGIYLGYKYYETRYEDYVMGTANTGDFDYDGYVAYPFGTGMSYTTWEYENYTVTEDEDNFNISLTVKNTGSAAGKHSVLIYMQKPYTQYDIDNGIEKSAVELVGFTKTGVVNGGGSEDVTVTVPKYMMRSYDSGNAKTYILDAGDYYLTAAGSSHEAVNNILAAKNYSPSSTSNRMDAAGNTDNVYRHTESTLDTEIFSTSYATGAEITNRFDDVDPNKDEYASELNDVTWVTRSNWTGTLPSDADDNVVIKYNDEMVNQARPVTYVADPDEQANTEMPRFGISNNLTLAMFMDVDYDDPIWYSLLEQMTYEETARLVTNCWYGSDAVASVGKNRQTDQDTSMGRSNPFTANPDLVGISFTSGDLRAATFNKDIMKKIGLMTGENNLHASTDTVKAVGLYGFSPNIHRSPYSGRNGEYFSEDAYITGIACGLAVEGMEEKGSVCFAKHFFLNDQEDSRHGIATWANEQTIRETYLPAFEYIITYGGSMGLMNSFNRIGMKWVGEHTGAQLDLLRDEWGFMGNIVTDLYEEDMQDVIDGLLAHTTMWLTTASDPFCYGLLTSDLYRNDPVIVSALVEAAHRMLYGASRNASMNGLSSADRIVEIMPWWQVGLITLIVVFAVLTVASIVLLVLSLTVFRKDKRENKQGV